VDGSSENQKDGVIGQLVEHEYCSGSSCRYPSGPIRSLEVSVPFSTL
jgi:hypothetical protein